MRNLAPPTLLWLIVALGVAVPHATSAQPLDTDAIDRAVQEIMGRIGIPGVALAVVRGDSVEHLRGYGVREVGTGEPVGAGTLFAIGSATKAFTATLVGMFEEEGRLEWDDPVVDHLPDFALSEPFPTATITLRDLLAHRSGLPAANLMWLPTHHPPDTLIDRLGHLEPVAGFRSRFTYQNILYLVAGQVLERISGSSWEELLEARLLAPLEMKDTNTSVATLTGRADVASPHVRSGGQAIPVPYRRVDDVAPAGAINSSVRDLARWLRLLLAEGETPDGRQLLQPATLEQIRAPETVVPSDPVMTAFHPRARLQAYGLGWFLSDFHGRTLVAHGGGIDGMSALVAWIPEEDLGVAVLTNLQTPAPAWTYGILYAVLDRALGVEATPWEAPYRELEAVLKRRLNGAAPARVERTRPSRPLEAYVGSYLSPTLGEIQLAQDEGGTLRLHHGGLIGTLEHWHFDTFQVTWQDLAWQATVGSGWVTFRLDRSGAVEGLTLEALPGDPHWLARRD